jgi:hypothetical protein
MTITVFSFPVSIHGSFFLPGSIFLKGGIAADSSLTCQLSGYHALFCRQEGTGMQS